LDGYWLEDYIWTVISNKKNFEDLSFLKNVKAIKHYNVNDEHNNKNKMKNEFELDFVVVFGYQLFVISVTSDYHKSLVKSKGFEVIERALQIGGEESKTILISRLNREKKEELEKELQIETGSGFHFIVLGEEDLKEETLVNKIKKFIEK